MDCAEAVAIKTAMHRARYTNDMLAVMLSGFDGVSFGFSRSAEKSDT